MNKDAFFQYKEARGQTGYGSAWLVKRVGEEKYSMLVATESVPYVLGDNETFEFDILQSPTKGQIKGKPTLEVQDIEVLHHRDNAYLFNKLKGLTLDFMSINAEFVGYKFVGTLDYRPNNAEADVNRATVTITPMSGSVEPVFNARGMVEETLCFASTIPETIKVGDTIDLSVVQSGVTPTIKAVKIADGSNEETDATASVISTDIKNVSISASGLYALTVEASGYASWTTTVYVESAT